MRKIIFVVSLFLVNIAFYFSQNQDIVGLAEGSLVHSQTLYDSDDELFGYIYIFQQDKIDDQNQKMEYVLLDKNLNKVSNQTFTKKLFKKVIDEMNIFLYGNTIIMNKFYYNYNYEILASTFQFFSLSDNTVQKEQMFTDGNFIDFNPDYKKFKNEGGNIEKINTLFGFTNKKTKGFFLFENNLKESYNNKEFSVYDENKNLKWKYNYNPNGTAREYINFIFRFLKNNNLYFSESKWWKGKYIKEFKVSCIDIQTGKKKYEYILENLDSKYSHTVNLHEIEGKLYISGNYSSYDKKDDFQLNDNLGFYQIVLDETGKEVSKRYTNWDEFKNKIDIDERGRVEKNYRLRPIQFFIFADGTETILTEKYKPANDGIGVLNLIPLVGAIANTAIKTSEKTTDFVMFSFDKEFKNKEVRTINKELTKVINYDYLFSQYIKNNTGVVFFYRDYVQEKNEQGDKEKKWILGINTIINGEYTQEKIPITSENKYKISPSPSKEGYILLREYNEEEKYNQIRLEKLNY